MSTTPLWRYAAGTDRGDVVFKDASLQDAFLLQDVLRLSQGLVGPLLVLGKDHWVNLTLLSTDPDIASSTLQKVESDVTTGSSSQTWAGAGGGAYTYSLASGPVGLIVEHDAAVAGVTLEEVDSFLTLAFVDVVDPQSCLTVAGGNCSSWVQAGDQRLMLVSRGFHNPAAGGTFHGGGFNEYLTTPIFGSFGSQPGQRQQVVVANLTDQVQQLDVVGDQPAEGSWPTSLAAGESAVISIEITAGWSLSAADVADGFGTFAATVD